MTVYVSAGAGNDRVLGGVARDSLYGGPGDDTLLGGGGKDLIVQDAQPRVGLTWHGFSTRVSAAEQKNTG